MLPDTFGETGFLPVTEEFEALGYAPEMLGEGVVFEEVVARLAQDFADAAGQQPELEGPIQIELLREIAGRAARQVEESVRQTGLPERLVGAQAPDLTNEDRSYLLALIRKLDPLPLGIVDVRDVGPGSESREITLTEVRIGAGTA